MPRKSDPLLFDFIKSLSGSEKGYFKKLFAKSRNHTKCINLVKAIEKQEIFDDEALKKAIYDQPIAHNKYSELKNYTFRQILKALHWYDEGKSKALQNKRKFLNVEVLYKRSFLDAAIKELKTVKEQAENNEDFLSLLEALHWEKELTFELDDFDFIEQEIERIDEEEKQFLVRLSQVNVYRNMLLQMLTLVKKGETPQHKVYRKKADKIMEHPLLKSVQQVQSYHAKIYFYRIHSIYAYASMDWNKFYQDGKELIKVMESNPYLLSKNTSEYISAFSNFMISCSVLKRYEEMKIHLNQFKGIKVKTLTDKQKVHRLYYLNSFEMCCRTGRFEEALLLLEQHFETIKTAKFDLSIFETNSFYFYATYIYFANGRSKEIVPFFSKFKKKGKKDLFRLYKIIDVVSQVDEKLFEILDTTIRNYLYFLSQQKLDGGTIFEMELVVVEWLKALCKLTSYSHKELAKVHRIFKAKFEKLLENPLEAALLQYFDIIAWLDSQIEGVEFGEAVKRRQ